ncbi:lanC-like protein 2 [Oppia nitens]|uniref:lanC-like protein 2 n=1 Tax=Oppia nitens TaxID=1686743 RepID=UPI0023DCAB1B|nr:lanC-like protein 2 [Oppia nitens]
MMTEKRYFDNNFQDYSPLNDILDQTSGQLNDDTKDYFLRSVTRLTKHLESNFDDILDENNYSVYTGSTGYGLLFVQLFRVLNDRKFLNKSLVILEPTGELNAKKVTFICGDSSLFAIKALVYHLRDRPNDCNMILRQMKPMVKFANDLSNDIPDEVLYGRSGLLYSLLFVRKYIEHSDQYITDDDIRSVVNTIIQSGLKTAIKDKVNDKCPLMYYWHEKVYIGAAHGLVGIIYMLLEANKYLTEDELNNYIKPTIEFIFGLRLSTGNYPSSLRNYRDILVHWCHGSPGAVHLFALAYRVFNEDKYLMAAKDCCECIWKRGLLTKGYGLCHGVAGNGYAFLRLYQLTNDVKYYYRAVKFGLWCGRYGEHGCRTPDRPFSLFEGMAGTIYYLSDLLKPNESLFPGFQLS